MTKRRVTQLVVGLAALVVAASVYFTFDPSHSAWFPKCPFLVLTGYKCPGCGSQRAVHALLTGNLATAWHYNALLVVALPFIGDLTRRSTRYGSFGQCLWSSLPGGLRATSWAGKIRGMGVASFLEVFYLCWHGIMHQHHLSS